MATTPTTGSGGGDAAAAAVARLLWAKTEPFHLLWRHLLDAAAVCGALLPRFGPVGDIPGAWLCCLVALHDVGKADALFQLKATLAPDVSDPAALSARLESLFGNAALFAGVDRERVRGFRHEARSADWLRAYLTDGGWGRRARSVAAAAIAGHHGDFGSESSNGFIAPDPYAERWDPLRAALADIVAGCVRPDPGYAPQDFAGRAGGASAVGIRLAGLIVLADWIASNHDLYRYPSLPDTDDPAAYFDAARAEAARAVARLGLDAAPAPFPAATAAEPLRFADVWPASEGFEAAPRPTQAALEEAAREGDAPPGLAIVEAPMGEGKTEAALYLAAEWQRQRGLSGGAYIALPTQATSNQMHGRYARYLARRTPEGAPPPRLVHGMAWLLDDDTPVRAAPQTFGDAEADPDEAERARAWFQNARRALLAPEAVGTVDQALFAALNVRHGFLRLFGLAAAGKTLVIDEVHAYDAFMSAILYRLLAWCRALSVPVILLSATLSRGQKAALVAAYGGGEIPPAPPGEGGDHEPYPLITFAPLDGGNCGSAARTRALSPDAAERQRRQRIALRPHPGLLARDRVGDAARLAADLARGGGCVCLLRNTVAAAQETYRALLALRERGELPEGTELLLFHARFRAERREQIERRVLSLFGKDPETGAVENPNRPARAVLVATQVVEQSLDVDFDAMISDLAPVDLLLQRSGRLHRHAGRVRPPGAETPALHVLLPEGGAIRPDFGTTGRVYDREILLRTLALLLLPDGGREAFDLPGDFRPLVEGCYGGGEIASPHVDADDLAGAAEARRKRLAEEEGKASVHLVAPPNPDSFSYAQETSPVDETEEGDTRSASYFRAQTRLGDATAPALVLTDARLIRAFERVRAKTTDPATPRGWSPPRRLLRALFRQKANLPAWWLTQAEPAEGFAPLLTGSDRTPGYPRWLRRHAVVVLDPATRAWRGTDRDGKPFTLRDEPDLGLVRESAAPGNAEPDADT